jgi:hypothetical protein
MTTLPDFKQYCEAVCIKLWGEPDKRTRKELRWNGGDAYSARIYTTSKHAWYDHGAERGGSTLELVAYAKGKPAGEKLRGRTLKALVELDLGAPAGRAMSQRFHRPIPIAIIDADVPTELSLSVSRRVCDIADAVHAELVVCPHVVAVLKSIHAKYSALRFRDFLTAMRLVELATREPGGQG